jgi:hypothetical protein
MSDEYSVDDGWIYLGKDNSSNYNERNEKVELLKQVEGDDNRYYW